MRGRRTLAAGCLATIAVADWVTHRRRPPWIVVGLFDHPAHLATAALVLLNLPPRSRRWTAGYMVGALLPDVDHVPLAINHRERSTSDARPMSHCLLVVAPVALLAGVTQSERLNGAAVGMLAHFARDLAVGSGVPLLWPASRRALAVSYASYLTVCTLAASRACAIASRRPPSPIEGV